MYFECSHYASIKECAPCDGVRLSQGHAKSYCNTIALSFIVIFFFAFLFSAPIRLLLAMVALATAALVTSEVSPLTFASRKEIYVFIKCALAGPERVWQQRRHFHSTMGIPSLFFLAFSFFLETFFSITNIILCVSCAELCVRHYWVVCITHSQAISLYIHIPWLFAFRHVVCFRWCGTCFRCRRVISRANTPSMMHVSLSRCIWARANSFRLFNLIARGK